MMLLKEIIIGGILLCGSCCAMSQCKSPETSKNQTAFMISPKYKPMTCKLTTPELQKRKTEVLASLKSKMLKKEELPNGFSYLFSSTDANIDEVTNFIKTERSCCDFFKLAMTVENENLWLTISGDKGAKDFITRELDL